jgi:uncharacterized membrane protein
MPLRTYPAQPGIATHAYPGWIFVPIGLWIVQLVIAYFVYKDARDQKMSAPLWFILVIIPFFGYLAAILYLIIREVRKPIEPEKTALDILKERFAKGEITAEEYQQASGILEK